MRIEAFHVIMAGGSGTRFWPVSRSSLPKQFLTLVGDRSLLRQAFDRAAAMSGEANVYVAAGHSHREMVLHALAGFPRQRLIIEPCARNTAPCIGLSALRLSRVNPDGVMVAAPADHLYTRPEALTRAISVAVQAARSTGALVTLGIKPGRPETGFGYIEVETGKGAALPEGVSRAARFVEKPDAATATAYMASGRHLWNSGVFIWKIGAILRAIETLAPELWSRLQEIDRALDGPGEEAAIAAGFSQMPSISIDYAVMEKASEVLVVPVDPGWSDVGSWDAASELQESDAGGNTIKNAADGETLLINSRDTFVYTSTDRFVAVVGVEDLIVVDAPGAVLVCRKGDSQSVRAVVEALKARGRTDLL